MPTPPSKTVIKGRRYRTKRNGILVVLDYFSNVNVKVMFIDTGHVRTATVQSIVNGSVKDPLCKNIFGFGFIGIGRHSRKTNTKGYDVWFRMIERCYSPEAQKKQKNSSYIGVTIDSEWSNFQNFSEWYIDHYIEGYEIDKDKNQDGIENKVYGPDTCVFISHKENSGLAHAKTYTFTSPCGIKTDVYNLSKFCRDKGLSYTLMRRVYSGRINKYKGWSKQ